MKDDAENEDLIVRYLLGDLSDEEQVEIEDRAFRDRQYLQSIQAVENDLIDEYAQGKLSLGERRQFESLFFASAERRRKVEFALALASVAPEFAAIEKDTPPVIAPEKAGWQSAFRAFLRGLSPAAKFSMAAAALLILIGTSWLIAQSFRLRAELADLRREQVERARQEETLQQQIAGERAHSEELSARLQREQVEREQSQQLIRDLERKQQESLGQPSQSTIASIMLVPGISRGGSARAKLVVAKTTRRVRVQIGIEPEDEYRRFRIELRAPGGQVVRAEDNLSARRGRAGQTVVLNLPASLLSAGEYELALKGVTGDGRTEDVGYYYFDVQKK